MAKENVQNSLNRIGFSDYEAKAYLALLEEAPANGYEVARCSGIPTSKVYQVLERLVAKKAVVKVETKDKKTQDYAPIAPDVLIDTLKTENAFAFEDAHQSLQEFANKPQAFEIFMRVQSKQTLIGRALELIDEADECLHVALWDNDFKEVYPNLVEALKRGIKLALVLYSQNLGNDEAIHHLQSLGGGAVSHSPSKMQYLEIMGNQFVLVCDRKKCISGTVLSDGSVDGAFTQNQGMVINAVDMVNHEIYLERILLEVGGPIKKIFGENLEKLESFDSPSKTTNLGPDDILV